MIKEIKGDLLTTKCDLIAHQVNCMGVFNKGLAKSIRELYPEVYCEYKKLINKYYYNYNISTERLLGECQIIKVNNNEYIKYVANLFGQLHYKKSQYSNKNFTEYDYLYEAMKKLKFRCINNMKSIAFPKNIGCGLAGGDWNIVYDIIKKLFEDSNLIVYIVDINN